MSDVNTQKCNHTIVLGADWALLLAGEGVPPVVMQEVAKMVAQSCSTCSKAMRAEGVKVACLPSPFSVLLMSACSQ